jgi:hypothetical protein
MAKIAVTLESAKDRFTRARKAACSADGYRPHLSIACLPKRSWP